MSEDILLYGQIFYKNAEDIDLYENCVKSLKGFDYKILIADSSQKDLTFNKNLCDYYLYDKENKLFDKKTEKNIYFYYECSSFGIKILCNVTQGHELNILYQNTKVFNLAKTIGYKYILRLECDTIYSEENIKDIKEKINECVSSDKKGVFVCDEEFLRMNMSFWDIDWYLEKIGNIKNENDWFKFLEKHNFSNIGIEILFWELIKNDKDKFINYNLSLPHYLKTFKYKETERFYESDVIIDFFKPKESEQLFFCVTNYKSDVFPEKLILNQYFENGGYLTNQVKNPGSVLYWVNIDINIKYAELIVNDKIFKLTKEELFSVENVIIFY
jgi:hypothetical protein